MSFSSVSDEVVKIDYNNSEASMLKFLVKVHDDEKIKKEPPSPVERSERLESIAMRDVEKGAHCCSRCIQKPSVCRRLNFDDPEDLEYKKKQETAITSLMQHLFKETQLLHQEHKELELLSERKRKADEQLAYEVAKKNKV